MKNKIKSYIGLVVSIFILLPFLSATPAFAMTCNTATLHGTVTVGNPPVSAWFEYGSDANIVAAGQGIPTVKQSFTSSGQAAQDISGLVANTTYYFRLVISDSTGTTPENLSNFTTPACAATPAPQVPTTPPTYYPPYYPPYNPGYPGYGQAPVVNLTVSQSSIPYAGSTYISWNVNNGANYCVGNGGTNGWANSQSTTSGTFPTGPLYGTTTYTMICTNNYGSGYGSVTVTVNQNAYYPPVTPVTNINPPTDTTTTIRDVNRIVRTAPRTTTAAPATANENTGDQNASSLGANAFWAGFFPTSMVGWLILILLIIILVLLARYAFVQNSSYSKKTITTTRLEPPLPPPHYS